MCGQSLQSCLTLCDPMDCSTPGSSVHGILQPSILEWGAISSSSRSSQARDQILTCCSSGTSGGSLTSEPLGKADNVKTGYYLKALTLCLAHTQTVSCKSLQNTRSECDHPTPHLTNEAQRQTPVQGYLKGYLIHMQRDPEAGPLALGPAPRPAETQGSGVGPLADLPTPHRLVSMTTELFHQGQSYTSQP